LLLQGKGSAEASIRRRDDEHTRRILKTKAPGVKTGGLCINEGYSAH